MTQNMKPLWSKGAEADRVVEEFTVGNDRVLDMKLAKYDVIGSKAHISMLAKVGLLKNEEEALLQKELNKILDIIAAGKFKMDEGSEDIHSQIENMVTAEIGETGKKIHSGRSRNDQVLVDIKLFLKDEIKKMKSEIVSLFDVLQGLSEKHKNVLLPGYTHGQVAMPSSFGLWFGAYAETLVDDIFLFTAAEKIADENPLGSAAGYGSSFPIDRDETTRQLGFSTMNYNSIAAQLSRGKCEMALASAIAALSLTLNKLASDCCEYMCGNYGFISFPDNLTTGSSIMPHKKNPDVWEIIRGKCNMMMSTPVRISLLCTNMPHGYRRDYQLLKDIIFPVTETMHKCLEMSEYMISRIIVRENILDDPKYNFLFTVEAVNKLVTDGVPFREAYKKIGIEVNNGTFVNNSEKSLDGLHHTHVGSIGNLCTEEIRQKMLKAVHQSCRTTLPEGS